MRKEGEILGLTWGLTGSTRNIIYATLAPTELFRINLEQFNEFLDKNPRAAFPLMDMLVDMYRLHSERILNLEYRSVRERIISFLFTTSQRFGQNVQQGVLIDVPLRHQDIASSISATRETTSRELAVLERQGLIIRNKQSIITLCDVNKLRSYLE